MVHETSDGVGGSAHYTIASRPGRSFTERTTNERPGLEANYKRVESLICLAASMKV